MEAPYRLTLVDGPTYEAALDHVGRYLYQQTPAFAEVQRRLGTKTDCLALYAGDQIVAQAKLNYYRYKRIFYAVSVNFAPLLRGGDLEAFDAFLGALLAYLRRKLRVLRLRIHPFIHRHHYGDFGEAKSCPEGLLADQILARHGFQRLPGDLFTDASLQANFYYQKDIRGLSYEAVLKSARPSLRYQMKAAARLGVKVRFLGPDELSIFDAIMADTFKRTGYEQAIHYHHEALKRYEGAYFPLAYLECSETLTALNDQLDRLSHERLRLQKRLAAQATSEQLTGPLKEVQNQQEALQRRIKRLETLERQAGDIVPLAASAFYASPSDMVYLQSGAYAQYMDFSPVYAIHETMLKEAIRLGCHYYNFFAVSGPDEASAPDAGVIAFKRQFKGELVEDLGTYEYAFY